MPVAVPAGILPSLALIAFCAPVALVAFAFARWLRLAWRQSKEATLLRRKRLSQPLQQPLEVFAHPGLVHDIWWTPVAVGFLVLLPGMLLMAPFWLMALGMLAVGGFVIRNATRIWPYVRSKNKKPLLMMSGDSLRYRDDFCVTWQSIRDARVVGVGRGANWLVLSADQAEATLLERGPLYARAYRSWVPFFRQRANR